MKSSVWRFVVPIVLVLLFAVLAVSCDQTPSVSTETETPGETSASTLTGTQTPDGAIFEIRSDDEITVRLNDTVFDILVPGNIDTFNLEAYAVPRSDIEWKVSAEITGVYYITDKKLPLTAGDNVYYLFCTDRSGTTTMYTLIIKKLGSCTVRFEGLEETQIVDEGGFATAPEKVPVRDGFVFKKWNFDFATPITSDVTITAIFDPVYYEISFDPRLGTMSALKLKVAYGEEVELETPVRTGYVFTGWYYGDEVVKSGVWTIMSDVTLVAQWTNRPFVVTLDPSGGTIDDKTDPVQLEVKFGEDFTLPTPDRPGFGFGGWFNGDTLVEGGVYEYPADLNLTARWNERSATITFVENGGDNKTHTETVPFDGELIVPVREGFTFGGWYSDEKLTVEVLSVPEEEKPVRLYAWWTEEGKPTEFIYELSGVKYKITDRIDRTSTTLIPAYIGGIETVDAVEKENPNAGITIGKKTLTVKIDRSTQIEAIFTPKFSDDDTTLVYESSNELIATVDENGLVTGVNANLGTCVITVSNPASGMTEICYVAVLADAKDPNASLTFSEESLTLTLGESKTLVADYIPEYPDDDRTLEFESSNELIASVDPETGVITANFLGDCVITVTTADGRFTAECAVKVVNEKFNEDPGIVLSAGELTINTGWVKTVTAVYTPRIAGSDTTVVWESGNPAIVSVADGVITALNAGECVVTVKSIDGEFTASVSVTVLEAGVYLETADTQLVAGTTGVFKAYILPDSENGSTEIVYSSDDNSVATVSNGVITAVSAGQCTLKAESVDGKYSVTSPLTVTAPKPEFYIPGSEEIEVVKSGNVWKLTVMTDVSFLQIAKLVEVRSGYSWILSKDVEMSEVIVNKAVAVPDSGTVRVYAYCHNADDSFMETYVIEVTKELHYAVILLPDGGSLDAPEIFDVVYGRSFTLPTPRKEGADFVGWFSGNEQIEAGVYSFKSNLTLTAKWSETTEPTSEPASA